MRVLLGIFLHRIRGAAVGIAFAQNRVHGRTLDRVIGGLHGLVLVRCRIVRIGGDGIALCLEFLDRGIELRLRGGDVRQLDNVCIRLDHQMAKLGQIVGLLLRVRQILREGCEDAACQRNVLGADGDPGRLGKSLDDRQEGRARQFRRFVDLGVDDVGTSGIGHVQSFPQFETVRRRCRGQLRRAPP